MTDRLSLSLTKDDVRALVSIIDFYFNYAPVEFRSTLPVDLDRIVKIQEKMKSRSRHE